MAKLIGRVGVEHTYGGRVLGFGAKKTFINGKLVAVMNDYVAAHWPCPKIPIHCSATMIMGSPTVYCEGLQVVRVNDKASCSHNLTQGSSGDVYTK